MSGLDPRGRRARVFTEPCIRRGVRQPVPHGGLRRGRRRSRDRPAGDRLALQQVSECGDGWRGAADFAPERIQDRQSHAARANFPHRIGPAAAGLRLDSLHRRRARAHADAPGHGGCPGPLPGGDPRHPASREIRRQHAARALADDRAHLTERVDGAQGGRRKAHRRVVQVPPGSHHRSGHQSRAPRAAGKLAQELPPAGAVRPVRPTEARAQISGPERRAAHGRQSGGERRPQASRPQAPGFRGVRGRRREARHRRHRGHPRARPVSARRGRRERGAEKFPDFRSGRDQVERSGGGLRDHAPAMGGGNDPRRRVPRA